MEDTARPAHSIHFDVFRADLQSGELCKNGQRVKLSGQPFEVLAMLLLRPGQLVTREDLQKKLWPQDTFVDFDHSLNTAINKIREALGDSAENPHFVETLPRRGYRFIAPVDSARSGVPACESAVETLPEKTPPKHWTMLLAPIVLIVAALGLAGWLWFRRSPVTQPEAPLTLVPLTSYPGMEDSPSFSPDGSQVAFMWNGEKEDNGDIYVKSIGSEQPMRLTTNPAREFSPAWSPDGRWIAFGRDLPGGKYAVVMIPPTGGRERILTELGSPQVNTNPPFLAWSPNSQWLAMVGRESVAPYPVALFLFSPANGETRQLTWPPLPTQVDSAPSFSPDGHALAFSRWMNFGNSDLYVLRLSPQLEGLGAPMKLTVGDWDYISPAWTADGTRLVFSAASGIDSGTSLWSVDASRPSSPQRLASLGENATSPAISRRGNRLAFAQWVEDVNIYRIELPPPGTKPGPPRKIIASTRWDGRPQISPDGKKIAFSSNRSGNWEIWVCDLDGSNPLQLTFIYPGVVSPARWSPDGKRLTFAANAEGRSELFIVDADGGNLKRVRSGPIAANYPIAANNPSWSRDGQWIYYDDLARLGLWRVQADGGQPVLLTYKVWGAVEARQRDSLYTMENTPKGVDLWKFPLRGGEPRKILESLPSLLAYSLVEDGIFFVPRTDFGVGDSLYFLDSATGDKTLVLRFPKAVRHISVSSDRRWIVYSQFDQVGGDLMLVENFR